MPNKYRQNIETVSVSHTTTAEGLYAESLGFFVYSLGVKNDTSSDVEVYLNRYTDDAVVVSAGSFQEIAVTTDYFRVEYAGAGENITVTYVKSAIVDSFLTPLFPNLYAQGVDVAGSVEDIKLNPINTGGYTFTPWAASDGSSMVGDNNALIEVDYYFNGQVVSVSNSTNFYQDLYSMILQEIEGYFPAGYVQPTNPEYSPSQFADVAEKASTYLSSYGVPLNEEFIGGWAAMTSYSDDLRLTKFSLAAGTDADKLQTPWLVFGFSLTAGAAGATVQYRESEEDAWNVETVAVDETAAVSANARFFEVTAGEVELSFSGNFVSMMEFAPILNIVYPLGFTETEGTPQEAFQSFIQGVEEFKNQLEAHKFTGRVVYFRAKPFESQNAPVHTADYAVPRSQMEPIRYVFSEIRHLVQNYYQYSRAEEDLLKAIVQENWAYYHPAPEFGPVGIPTMLEEVIEDANVSIRGLTSEAQKREFIVNLLIQEYRGIYSTGGFSLHTVGQGNNRIDS